MFVADWMTKNVSTVSGNTNIAEAIKTMREKRIKRLPVVDEKAKVVGILSDRDIKEYTPSKVASFDVYELNYILFTTKVKTFMKKKVLTTSPTTAIEDAAMTMLDNDIGCLPVVSGNRLVGIISDRDLFRVLVDITGVRQGRERFSLLLKDRPDVTREALDTIEGYIFLNSFTGDHYLPNALYKAYKRYGGVEDTTLHGATRHTYVTNASEIVPARDVSALTGQSEKTVENYDEIRRGRQRKIMQIVESQRQAETLNSGSSETAVNNGGNE
jgi:acetoin utilization protein AcuB